MWRTPCAALAGPGGTISSIVGRTHTVIRPGRVKERRQLSDKEFAAALTAEFALPLTPGEIAALVAAPTGG
jgi:N-hydroxyarylamine O-acetyltransferase